MAALLGGVLLVLFWKAFEAGNTVASNDGPLGVISSQATALPSGFFGFWQDLNWLGLSGTSAPPDISQFLGVGLGKLVFSKLFAPFAVFFLGLSAWFCFRQWRLSPFACLLGGLAAGLNSGFFSAACWGVASQTIAFGLDFLALAALADRTSPRRWLRVALAGFAIGMNVMEAYDIGALFSVVIGAFVLVQALVSDEGTPVERTRCAFGRLAVIVPCAVLISISTLTSLVDTQIKGISGMGQDPAEKARRWDEATIWSLPKREALNLIVPGLYGFRTETPKDMALGSKFFANGKYWGAVGRNPRLYSPEVEKNNPGPRAVWRSTGGGNYAGVLVVIGALWAIGQSFRKDRSAFDQQHRRFIWFWGATLFICLLLSFGKFAPFYRVFYALPYASTVRNPGKFLHLLAWAMVILFAYGVDSLCRLYLLSRGEEANARQTGQNPTKKLGVRQHMEAWWQATRGFERNWVIGCLAALGVSIVAWFIYASMHGNLVDYLSKVGFDRPTGEELARFSLRQAAWFVIALATATFLLALIISGFFRVRARLGRILLGAFVVFDLASANLPWVIVWNYRQKYDMDVRNPVLDFLKEKPYEGRVTMFPVESLLSMIKPNRENAEELRNLLGLWDVFQNLYGLEWLQHQFQYYNIQSLDVVMMPRRPVDCELYERTVGRSAVRHWELTNTRYFLAPYALIGIMNQAFGSSPGHPVLQDVVRFDITTKSGDQTWSKFEELTAMGSTNGALALMELTTALPRAKLYNNYLVSTDEKATLSKLVDPKFDLENTVLVDDPLPPLTQTKLPPAGRVKFTSYAPKDVVLEVEASAPGILLLNDRYDSTWQATLDGKPAALLKCNFLMRGVQVPSGKHRVEFRFQPPMTSFYVSLAAVVFALGLLAFTAFSKRREKAFG